jgi:hypothetical protein
MRPPVRPTSRHSLNRDLSKPRLWARPLLALVSLVLRVVSAPGSLYVASAEQITDHKMLMPDTTKENKHKEWCAINFGEFAECDCKCAKCNCDKECK